MAGFKYLNVRLVAPRTWRTYLLSAQSCEYVIWIWSSYTYVATYVLNMLHMFSWAERKLMHLHGEVCISGIASKKLSPNSYEGSSFIACDKAMKKIKLRIILPAAGDA